MGACRHRGSCPTCACYIGHANSTDSRRRVVFQENPSWPHFPKSRRSRTKAPSRRTRWPFATTTPNEMVEGKSMKDHLRFSVAYWHTMRGTGGDPFGPGTMLRPWEDGRRLGRERAATACAWPSSSWRSSARRSSASTIATSPPRARRSPRRNKNLDAVVKVLKEEMQRTGIKLLWGTANLFSNPRYMHGAATSCNADAFAYRRGPGEEGPGSDQGARRRGLRVLGRPRRLPDPLEHRHEARAGPPGPLHAHGRRLRQEDRLHRASSTSSPSPRSRPSTSTTSTPRPASTSSGPTAWPTTSSSTSRPTTPRWPATPSSTSWNTPATRASWARSTPTPATCCWAGTPTSSRPTST